MTKRISTLIFVIGLASACAVQADSRSPGNSPTRGTGGSQALVCVDTKSHVYWMKGVKCCDGIKKAKYMTEAKAIKEGYKLGRCFNEGKRTECPSCTPTPPPGG